MNKVRESIEQAISDIEDGAVIAIGGFFAAGVPRLLLKGIIDKGLKGLTLCCGSGPLLGAMEELNGLVEKGQIKKIIDSYPLFRSASKGAQHPFEQQVRNGAIVLEIYPMGTLAEKYRAAGAGIPAFFTPVGSGSMVEDAILTNVEEDRHPRETRVFNGKKCILEYALQPDFSLVHAHTGDEEGNLRYRRTARNFNHVMAMAAKTTIAEVENLCEPGGIDSDSIHTPGIFVQRVVKVPRITFDITNL
jgi:3-oxoacid CoA-transferase A subunit